MLHLCLRGERAFAAKMKNFLRQNLAFRGLCSSASGEEAEDEEFRRIRTQYFLPAAGQKVVLIQPRRQQRRTLTLERSSELLGEARALVATLETWVIVAEHQATLRSTSKATLFTPGVFKDLTEKIRSRSEANAVFINWPSLTGFQLASLQRAWRRLVYDRYTLVLQIFHLHSRTHEAKLQVALAEVPYLRSRMSQMHDGSLDEVEAGLMVPSLLAKKHSLREKMEFLDRYRHRLVQKLKQLEAKQDFLRRQRRASDVPVVTVIGYTNAGKTSLIKQLSAKDSIAPCDKLFATLDVTNHHALLANNWKVVLVDTIGFFSDIPTSLIAAFKTTLKDCMDTDLLIHVADVSHSHVGQQVAKVKEVLASLRLPAHLEESMITVANKSDSTPDSALSRFLEANPEALPISCVTARGLADLRLRIQAALSRNLGCVRRKIRANIGGLVHEWVGREATLEKLEVCPEDNSKAILTVLFSPSALSRFEATFRKKPSGDGVS